MHKNTFDHSNTTVLAIYSPLRAPTRATFWRGPQITRLPATPKLLRTCSAPHCHFPKPSRQPIGSNSDCPMHHHPSAHLSSWPALTMTVAHQPVCQVCCPHGARWGRPGPSRPAIRSGDAPLAARLVPMPVKWRASLPGGARRARQACPWQCQCGRCASSSPEFRDTRFAPLTASIDA